MISYQWRQLYDLPSHHLQRFQFGKNYDRNLLPTSKLFATSSKSLESWLYEQGCKKDESKITFNEKKSPITAIAKTTIKEGDLLFSIPVGLSLDNSKMSPKITQVININALETKELGKLALLLLYEKSLGKDSKYAPYIQSLPVEPPGILSWSKEDLQELCQSSTRDFTILLSAIENDISYLSTYSIDFLSKNIDKDFRWAIGTVKSRRIRLDDKWSLLPGIDSIAFDPFAENEPVISSSGLFSGKTIKVQSDRSYSFNDEVYMSYGIKTSAQCVEDHGIIPSSSDTNESDLSCEISVSIDEAKDRFPDDKIGILEENDMTAKMQFDLYGDISASTGGSIDIDLLRFLRLKLISGKDCFILEACFSNSVFATLALPFSRNNEIDVVNYLIKFCQEKLAMINNVSNEENDKLISSEGNLVKGLLAKLRIQERSVLKVNLDFLLSQLESLQGPADFREYYQERRLKELDLLRPLDESEIVPID